MKILIDTNVLISAFVFGGKAGSLLELLFDSHYTLLILSDALYHEADIILSGDKDFLEADLEKPLIYSPAMMYEFLMR